MNYYLHYLLLGGLRGVKRSDRRQCSKSAIVDYGQQEVTESQKSYPNYHERYLPAKRRADWTSI